MTGSGGLSTGSGGLLIGSVGSVSRCYGRSQSFRGVLGAVLDAGWAGVIIVGPKEGQEQRYGIIDAFQGAFRLNFTR